MIIHETSIVHPSSKIDDSVEIGPFCIVGENVEIRLLCPDDEETYVTTKINLEDVSISVGDGHTNNIQLTDKIKLVMKTWIFQIHIKATLNQIY